MKTDNVLDINWNGLDKRFNFAAMNSDGRVKLFTVIPEIFAVTDSTGFWSVPYIPHSGITEWGVTYSTDGESILKEPVNWSETLTERPDTRCAAN